MKTLHSVGAALVWLASLISQTAQASDIQLYPTGPAEDSSFVRFVNASSQGTLEVRAAGATAALALTPQSRASAYMPVAGTSKIEGQIRQGEAAKNIQVQMQPGMFVTVLSLATDQGLQTHEIREEGDGFTAVRASIAFYDLNPNCQNAAIYVTGRKVALFENVTVGQWVRRQINPVPLRVQLMCAGQATGPVLDMGTLQAGERYSLFLVPGDPAQSLMQLQDKVAH